MSQITKVSATKADAGRLRKAAFLYSLMEQETVSQHEALSRLLDMFDSQYEESLQLLVKAMGESRD